MKTTPNAEQAARAKMVQSLMSEIYLRTLHGDEIELDRFDAEVRAGIIAEYVAVVVGKQRR